MPKPNLLEPLMLWISRNKLTSGLIFGILGIVLAGGYLMNSLFASSEQSKLNAGPAQEINLDFDPEGPYAVLVPRPDGNAIVLQIKRVGSYDAISYELAYSSEGIDRGVVGDINTKDKKGEYQQEILFGTCSKNVCKYDKDVENGTLTLRIRKGKSTYVMVTQWHLQRPEIAKGELSSGDRHFIYKLDPKNTSLVNFSLINDLSGAPKLPLDKQVIGKVYALNVPVTKVLPQGNVTIELAQNPAKDSKIARFDETLDKWVELDTQAKDSTLKTKSEKGGIFTVFSPKE